LKKRFDKDEQNDHFNGYFYSEAVFQDNDKSTGMNDKMLILQEDNGYRGCFFVEAKRKRVAELHYVWSGPERIIIDHTVIRDHSSLKGYAKHLVKEAVMFAGKNGLDIVALCPIAYRVLKSVPVYLA
jgi:predicted GNAT family acetyltransferase